MKKEEKELSAPLVCVSSSPTLALDRYVVLT